MKTKKIINGLLIVFAIVVVFLAIYHLFFSVKFDESYLQAVKSKRAKLEKVEYKKIVITGNVNIATGINSNLIEKEIGIPVVNMATNSSIGYKSVLNYVKRDLNANDILIFSPGYDIVSDLGWQGLEKSKISESNSFFTADVFNKDNLKEDISLENINIDNTKLEISEHTFPKEAVSFIKDYNKFLQDQGVSFYISPSFYAEGVYKKDIATSFWGKLSKETGVPLLGDSNFLNKKHFFKSPNVFSSAGRVVATKKLTKNIKSGNILNLKNTYLVPKETLKSSIGLANFNDFNSVKVLEKDNSFMSILPEASNNYVRIKHKNKDYTNYTFSIELECSPEDANNIKFMGTAVDDFDYIIKKNDNTFEFFKENMSKVFYKKNKSSYLGVAFTNVNNYKIKKVSLNKVSSRFYSSENAKNEMSLSPEQKLSFRVFNAHKKFKISEIFKTKIEEDLLLNSNTMFRLETEGNSLYIRDFYSGQNIYKQELNDNFKLKSFENTLLEVFE